MNTTKLTLKLDQAVIERTKEYAKERHLTLSGMVENYFRALVGARRASWEATPMVRELSGAVSARNGRRWKKRYVDYLADKYGP